MLNPNAENTYDIEINFSVTKEDQIVVRYPIISLEHPVVWQQFPMKQTVIVKTTDEEGKETETTETRDLESGTYRFSMEIKDNLSGKSVTKSVEIEVR